MNQGSDIIRGGQNARKWLEENNYPYSDEIPLKASPYEFMDGGHYGLEMPVVNSLKILEQTIECLRKNGINRIRFGETKGSFLLSDKEIRDMLALCRDNSYGMLFSIGPRPEYDRKAAFYRSEFGLEQGRHINNNDGIACAVEDALRLTSFGCRALIVYDIGVMRILNRMKKTGALPSDTLLATSTHSMVCNPMIAEIHVENGAGNLVVLHDIGLPVLQEMRKVLKNNVSISLPIDVYASKGGFIRYYEIPEIIQIAAPVMLKLGASAQAHPYDSVGQTIIEQRVKNVLIGLEFLERSNLPLKMLNQNSSHWCIPKLR